MKKCPYSAEEIQDEAIKCRYCGEGLEIQSEIDLNGEHLTEYEKTLRDRYREMPIDSLKAFKESYNPEEYTPEAQRIIAKVFKERSKEFNCKQEFTREKKKISEEEYVIRAIKKLQGNLKGIHSENSGLSQAFIEYYGKDPIDTIQLLSQEGKIITKSVTGGHMLYLPEELHHERKGVQLDLIEFDISIYTDNAYRILGIPFNASKKEVVQRVEEIQTLIKIGIPPSYDTDVTWIDSLIRSEETTRNSFNVLNNPKDKLLHLFSWFWISDEFDKSAIKALSKKDISNAFSLWSVQKKNKDIIRVK